MRYLAANVHGKGKEADEYADDVDDVVAVVEDLAGAAAVFALLPVRLQRA